MYLHSSSEISTVPKSTKNYYNSIRQVYIIYYLARNTSEDGLQKKISRHAQTSILFFIACNSPAQSLIAWNAPKIALAQFQTVAAE